MYQGDGTMDNEKITIKPYTKERRKQWKKQAKHTLKTHYVILVMVALLAALIGVEGGYSFSNYDLADAKYITSEQFSVYYRYEL